MNDIVWFPHCKCGVHSIADPIPIVRVYPRLSYPLFYAYLGRLVYPPCRDLQGNRTLSGFRSLPWKSSHSPICITDRIVSNPGLEPGSREAGVLHPKVCGKLSHLIIFNGLLCLPFHQLLIYTVSMKGIEPSSTDRKSVVLTVAPHRHFAVFSSRH